MQIVGVGASHFRAILGSSVGIHWANVASLFGKLSNHTLTNQRLVVGS